MWWFGILAINISQSPLYVGPPQYTAVSVQTYLQYDAEPNEGGDSQVRQLRSRECVHVENFPTCQRVRNV